MINLPNLTFLIVDCLNLDRAINTLNFCNKKILFYESKVLTNLENAKVKNSLVKIREINSKKDFSYFCMKELNDYFKTDYVLIGQYDGYILHEDMWDDEFLDYDYIGAPWPWKTDGFVTPFGEHISVGNGGFSLRSKKLLEVPSKVEIPFDVVSMNDFYKMFGAINWNEDGNICVHNRHIFEKQGCKFAPVEVAKYFSHESPLDINKGIVPFGFHGNLPSTIELI